jgi:hypothetical protein
MRFAVQTTSPRRRQELENREKLDREIDAMLAEPRFRRVSAALALQYWPARRPMSANSSQMKTEKLAKVIRASNIKAE